MRIYAVADIHGKAERLDIIRANLRKYRADVLVAAGDIANYGSGRAVLAALNDLGVKVMVVRGNTDWPGLEDRCNAFSRLVSLNLQATTFHGCHFTGVGGTVPLPFRSQIALRENRSLEALAALVRPESAVVVHPPPRGTLDRVMGRWPAGSAGLAIFVRRFQPALLICGHIHDRAGNGRIGRTVVVNATMGGEQQGALIDFERGRVLGVAMLAEPKDSAGDRRSWALNRERPPMAGTTAAGRPGPRIIMPLFNMGLQLA
jgi:hypothetical protein